MKPVALFDLDNTLYDGFSPFALLQELQNKGLASKGTTDAVMACFQAYKDGNTAYEIFAKEVLDKFAAGLQSQSYARVYGMAVDFYTNSPKMHAYAKPVFALLEPSHERILVTADPQFIAQAFKEVYRLDGYCSTQYEVKDGLFTGQVSSYLAFRHEKHNAVKHLLEGHARRGSFAFGDSEGDAEMLSAVENPICVNPSAELRELAAERGWSCVNEHEVEAVVREIIASDVV